MHDNEADEADYSSAFSLALAKQHVLNASKASVSQQTLLGMAFLLKCFGGSPSTSTKRPSPSIEHLCHRFSLVQLRKSTQDFDESRIIGEGPYGVAYRASISVNGQLKHVAVKRLRREAEGGISLYKKDIIFMCQLHHPNLVSLVGFCDDHNEMIVVYDYASNGSLFHQLYGIESNSPRLPWKKRLEISIGVARGLHYLHSGTKRTIIYGNISPVNILLDENWVPKLSFFGLSMKAPKLSGKDVKRLELESVEGTWESPNVMHKTDVYSFGVVLLELICGKTSFRIISEHEVHNLAEKGKAEGIVYERFVGEIAPQCLKLYLEITESCLSEDPCERPDMGEVEVQLERVLEIQEEADCNHT